MKRDLATDETTHKRQNEKAQNNVNNINVKDKEKT